MERGTGRHTTAWVSHVLRREAEALILPNLPAFLNGSYQPLNNDERLSLTGICQFQRRYRAAARLYFDAFDTDPSLADNLTAEFLRRITHTDAPPVAQIAASNSAARYLAARSAALAGSGLGKDGGHLTDEERARWRKQAREWLRADLAVWTSELRSESQSARDFAARILMNSQGDPDLAGIRDPSAMKTLSAEERDECLALWNEVEALLKHSGNFK